MGVRLCVFWCVVLGGALPVRALEATDIKQRPGLVLTTTTFANVIVSGSALGNMDTEDHFSLTKVSDEGLTYLLRMSVNGDAKAEELSRRLRWPRAVRREDLEQSSRLTLLYSSTDPESYGGQTFAETSRKVLTALKSTGESPLVIGVYSNLGDSGGLAGLLGAAPPKPAAAPAPSANGAPPLPDLGTMLNMAFGSARHYYRGTLKRAEPQDVPVAVLVNGVRTPLPAVHAAGTFTFGQDPPQKVEFWWLDNPDWPLTLRWTFGPASQLITRIDWPDAGSGGASGAAGAGGAAAMAAQLQGKQCRVELHGVYFNSGSAVLLEESEPMLKEVAALVKSSPEGTLTIEGHTDNIGSAQYNQSLSERRAAAVRDALVTRYGIGPGRLLAKGYGLTRPVETNTTFEGRARNRRVELSRPCLAQ